MLLKFTVLRRVTSLFHLSVRNKATNGKISKLQQLKPKTPEDEYSDLFQKTLSKPCDNPSKIVKAKPKPVSVTSTAAKPKCKAVPVKTSSAQAPNRETKKLATERKKKIEKSAKKPDPPCGLIEVPVLQPMPTLAHTAKQSPAPAVNVEPPKPEIPAPPAPQQVPAPREQASPTQQILQLQTPDKGKKPCVSKEAGPTDADKDERLMEALILTVKDKEVALGQVPIPTLIKKNEVSIKVRYAAAGLADLRVIEGTVLSSAERVIPGRELSGVVCGTGTHVQHVKAGDTVVVAPCHPRTLCKFCYEEKYEVCVKESGSQSFGVDRDGGWAQYATVPSNLVYKIKDVKAQQAVLLPLLAQTMCSLAQMNISPHMEVLILGCGLAGAFFALLLHHNGHERVSIWEDNPIRAALVAGLGTPYPVIGQEDVKALQLDLVISSGGGAGVMQEALAALAPHGQFVVFGQTGLNGRAPQLTLPTSDMSARSVRVRGMSGTPINPSKIPIALANKLLHCDKLGVTTYSLKEFKEGLTELAVGDTNAVLFQICKEK